MSTTVTYIPPQRGLGQHDPGFKPRAKGIAPHLSEALPGKMHSPSPQGAVCSFVLMCPWEVTGLKS
jgi:hypothetical protein